MCGRAKLETDWSEIAIEYTAVLEAPAGKPRYNVAPTDVMPIIEGAPGRRVMRVASWGLTVWGERAAKLPRRPINARAETVSTNGLFASAFRNRRCLVPADGFYEWTVEKDGRQPWLFARPGGQPFVFAGLWSRWLPEGRDPVDTYVVLTTRANALTRPVHDRMPVILPDKAAADTWLDPTAELGVLTPLLGPAPDDYLVVRPVSRRLNKVSQDDPSVLVPDAPGLFV